MNYESEISEQKFHSMIYVILQFIKFDKKLLKFSIDIFSHCISNFPSKL